MAGLGTRRDRAVDGWEFEVGAGVRVIISGVTRSASERRI
jgi:hypothetical protein